MTPETSAPGWPGAGRSEIDVSLTRGPSHLRWGGGEGGNKNKKTQGGPGGPGGGRDEGLKRVVPALGSRRPLEAAGHRRRAAVAAAAPEVLRKGPPALSSLMTGRSHRTDQSHCHIKQSSNSKGTRLDITHTNKH